ncbi:uncharacterized protein [Setaria viridis]|uniref:uncharacterized protein n=1 Tax=Setaria viridis TaxID=4556 RepID=UPI003B3AEC9D
MDGHGDDHFSQPDPAFPSGAFDLYSQADSYQGPRSGMQALDLNSQVDEFPAFSSYADILRGEDGGVARGGGARTPGLRVAHNGGGDSRGGGATRGGGASGSKVRGAGGSRGCGAARSRGGGAIRGGGTGGSRGGGRVTRNLFIGSASDGGAAGGGGRGGGRVGGRRRRGGSDHEGYLYADEGNAPEVADGVEVIFPGSSKDASSSTEFSSDDEDNHIMEELSSEDETMELILHCRKRNREFVQMMLTLGMYYESYIHKAPRRVATVTGIEWVNETLSNTTSCYNMFRMSCPLFHQLHDLLVDSYGLRGTRDMSTVEALGMFLWILGAPQSLRQVEDRFVRSLETISRTFDKVLGTVLKLAVDNIRPLDPQFKTVHKRLLNPRFAPYFNNCIGAIDGTHVPVVVPSERSCNIQGGTGIPHRMC